LVRLWQEQYLARKMPAAVAGVLAAEHPWRTPGRHLPPCSAEDALDRLHPNEVALIFMTGSERSYVLLLQAPRDGGGPPVDLSLFELPGYDRLDGLIDPLLRPGALANTERARELGATAYRGLLGPMAERLCGKDLLILPDGPIAKVPFEMLVEPDEQTGHGRFLVEGHRIRYSPSLSALPPRSRAWLELPEERMAPFWAVSDYVGLSPYACAGLKQDRSYERSQANGGELFDLGRSALVLRKHDPTMFKEFWALDEAGEERLLHSCRRDVYSHSLSIAERLRRAQLEMIQAGEPPLHWASVIYIGD
jgi:hypothetical protein